MHLVGGQEVTVVTGIDDHSRFIVRAKVMAAATAGPVCLAPAGWRTPWLAVTQTFRGAG